MVWKFYPRIHLCINTPFQAVITWFQILLRSWKYSYVLRQVTYKVPNMFANRNLLHPEWEIVCEMGIRAGPLWQFRSWISGSMTKFLLVGNGFGVSLGRDVFMGIRTARIQYPRRCRVWFTVAGVCLLYLLWGLQDLWLWYWQLKLGVFRTWWRLSRDSRVEC